MAAYRETLCWRCKKAVLGCSWSEKFEPVEGWDAEPTTIRNSRHYRSKTTGRIENIVKITGSYCVKSCPLFEEDDRSMRSTITGA